MTARDTKGCLHGFGDVEEARLTRQARIVEHRIHGTLPLRRCRQLLEVGGGVGAKLGNLLQRAGFAEIETEVRPVLLDNRQPGERAEFPRFWTELLLSGSEEPVGAEKVDAETVGGMQRELGEVATDPDAAFVYAFVHARGRTA